MNLTHQKLETDHQNLITLANEDCQQIAQRIQLGWMQGIYVSLEEQCGYKIRDILTLNPG